MAPMNPALHAALQHEFGKVIVAHPGIELTAAYRKAFNGRLQMRVITPGEYYRVNCPFCPDTRHRLWINHRWGVPDQKTGTRNHWLAICYNEDCLRDDEKRDEFIRRTSQYHRSAISNRIVVHAGVSIRPEVIGDVGKPIWLPSDFVPLDQLEDDHPARCYLRERRFDPEKIFKRWGVGFSARNAFCLSPNGRLVIPIHRLVDGKSVRWGWQARQIIDRDNEPKYFTAGGLKKSHLLFGIQRVDRTTSPVLIVEGPTDVWRAGKNAVGLLGNHASAAQVQLMCQHFAKRPLVIALDADAAEEAQILADKIIEARLTSLLRPDRSPVIVAKLSAGRDPADYKRSELWELVQRRVRVES